ncbi:MAG: hypothetical protein HC824_01410 [Synechococcales cyanobacterium RM1_1_8]|nr:hypothetical protein [Synechococcales cyanobacterium RM1_1_8]
MTSNLQTFGTLVGGTGNDTYNVSRNTIALIYETGGDSGDRLKFSEPLFSNTLAQTTGFAEIDGRHLFIVRNNDFGGDQTIAQIADWRVPGNRIEVFEDSTGAIYSFDDFARRLTSSPNYLGSLSYEQLLSVSGSNFSPADIQQSRNDIDATLVRSRQLDIAPTFYLRNQATGSNVAWFTDYGRILQGTPLEIPTLPTHWQLEATGDLNQDGKDDLIWWNRNTGEAAVWFMDRSRFLGATGIVSPDVNSGWRIQGAGDLNAIAKTTSFGAIP